MNPSRKWPAYSIVCAAWYVIAVALFCYFWFRNAAWDWFVGTIAVGLIGAASLWFALWQDKDGRVLPTVDGYHAAMLPYGLSLIAIVLPAAFYPMMRPDTGADALDASLIIGLVVGVAGMLSLGVSLAVLVQIQTVFTGEKELMKHAIDALQLVRTKLIFVTLTPNLGYAACVANNDAGAIDGFHRAMIGALEGLRHESECGEPVHVFLAILNDQDAQLFYRCKELGLGDSPGLEAGETRALSYRRRSEDLARDLLQSLNQMNNCTVHRFPNCLANDDGDLKHRDNYEVPLGILLVDDRMGVVFFHDRLLTNRPVPLRGYITKDPEQVRALEALSRIYVGGASPNAQAGN